MDHKKVQNIAFKEKGGGHSAKGIFLLQLPFFNPFYSYESLFATPAPQFSTLHADFTCDEELELAVLCCGKCMASCLPCCPAKSLPIRDSARLMMSRIRWIKPSLSDGRMNSLCTLGEKKETRKKKERERDRGHWTAWRKNNIMEWKSRDKQLGWKILTGFTILSDYI